MKGKSKGKLAIFDTFKTKDNDLTGEAKRQRAIITILGSGGNPAERTRTGISQKIAKKQEIAWKNIYSGIFRDLDEILLPMEIAEEDGRLPLKRGPKALQEKGIPYYHLTKKGILVGLAINGIEKMSLQLKEFFSKSDSKDKEFEMNRFLKGETQIMVATTVIEVGVNVPNASVMIIESAERFGLSQLHQLRGRVGRGADQSYCVLMTSHKLSENAKTRIKTMVKTSDGFEIAEVDLKLRGPGDLMGTQQSGILNLRIADIVKDHDILNIARNAAIDILKSDPSLSLSENLPVKMTYLQLAKYKNIWNFIS